MNEYINRIKGTTEPLRQQIIHHKVFSAIKNISDLRIFMQYHIYAVWDFMSLLKVLQRNLTCTTVPWFPVGSADTRYLINEIVVGEECDIDSFGNRKSHFELYMDAMYQCGADTSKIETFIEVFKKTGSLDTAFVSSETPIEIREFVGYTFKIIHSSKDYLQASVFTFGREDLIPDMFLSIIDEMHSTLPDSISIFKYYLERHIEVDGNHHSTLALQMISNLCGTNNEFWNEAEAAAINALKVRISLWDGVYQEIINKNCLSGSNPEQKHSKA